MTTHMPSSNPKHAAAIRAAREILERRATAREYLKNKLSEKEHAILEDEMASCCVAAFLKGAEHSD